MDTLEEMIRKSNYIVFFGGAGVSTESGIPDFRGAKGLYKKREFPAEIMLSHTFYEEHPEEFQKFYLQHLVYPKAEPNPAHRALAHLEKMGKLKAVITQNIDGLHQKAGSKNVLELHGSIHRNTCQSCGRKYSLEDILKKYRDFRCICGGRVKPDVVLYEEPLDNEVFEAAIQSVSNCDMFIIGGTSLAVYPAASLIHYFKGKYLVLINQTETPYDYLADLVIHAPIADVLSKWVEM